MQRAPVMGKGGKKRNDVMRVQKDERAVRHVSKIRIRFVFLALNTSFTLMTIGQTISLPKFRYGGDFDKWYDAYVSRETISDPTDLPAPSQAHVDVWKKRHLAMPYPPKYKNKPSSTVDRQTLVALNHHYSMLHMCDSMLENAYIEYMRYGLDVTPIIEVCNAMRKVLQINSWKRVWENTTSVKKAANETLGEEISSVRRATDALFKRLVEIKRKEYANWADKHPQQAMNIAMKKRLLAAEQRAQAAEWNAQNAISSALNAAMAAENAEYEAAEARRNAANAANAARDAARRAYEAENRWGNL